MLPEAVRVGVPGTRCRCCADMTSACHEGLRAVSDEPARRNFRVLTRTRGGYNGSTMYDVQLQAITSGNLVWAQTFTDHDQATAYERDLEADLDDLDDATFRRKYSVPSTA
jgi:hypothetical protein